MTIDDAIKRYSDAMKTATGRADGLLKQADAAHQAAVRKADATHQLAVKAAADELAATTARTDAQLRRKLAEQVEEFDTAAKAALHAPAESWIRTAGPTRWELRIGTVPTPVAVAVDEGARGWHVNTETELKFLGSAVQVRAELWRIAAALPVPTPAA